MPITVTYISSKVEKRAIRVLSLAEKALLDLSLIANPKQGLVMPRTGGARKIRLSIRHKRIGRRGGARAVLCYWDTAETVYVFDVYSKDQKADIDEGDKKAIKEFIESLD